MPNSYLPYLGRLQQMVSSVPRPWELTPGTSVAYQMTAGSGPFVERIRKGVAQSIGRYATNIKSPYDYELPSFKDVDMKSVLKDSPSWLQPGAQTEYFGGGPTDKPATGAEEVLYREMFDLPSRVPLEQSGLKQTGPKEYTLDGGPLAPDPATNEEGVNYGRVLGKYTNQYDPKTQSLTYRDTWDIVSPPGTALAKNLGFEVGNYGGGEISDSVRRIVAPILRPATVSGSIPVTKR